jgi:hypothetical protein
VIHPWKPGDKFNKYANYGSPDKTKTHEIEKRDGDDRAYTWCGLMLLDIWTYERASDLETTCERCLRRKDPTRKAKLDALAATASLGGDDIAYLRSDLEHARAAGEALQRLRAVAERDRDIFKAALIEAISVIEGLEGQQAMPDYWYSEKLTYFKALTS